MRAFYRQGLTVAVTLTLFIGGARAAEGAISPLLEEGCLPADGGPEIAVPFFVSEDRTSRGALILSTTVGRFSEPEPVGSGVFIARFSCPALKENRRAAWQAEWRLAAKRLSSTFEVDLCPHPVGTVKVTAEPASLLAGQGQQSILTIEVKDEGGKAIEDARLEVSVNVGQIRHLRHIGGGLYQAVYLPPDDPFPQIAIVLVAHPRLSRFDRVAAGRTVIPITARINLPGRTMPGTRMTMEVAGRSFGPVQADREGRFEIPILVPPGVQRGLATSVDLAGNRKSQWVDFFLPPTNQLNLWTYPQKICADGISRTRLLITTMDAAGRPVDVEKLRFDISAGSLDAKRRLEQGLLEAYFVSPQLPAGGQAQVKVRFPEGGPRSEAVVDIELLAGLADSLSVEAPLSLAADGKSAATVEVRVLDREKKLVGGKLLQAEGNGLILGQPVEVSPGIHRFRVSASPNPTSWQETVKITVTEQPGETPSRIVVSSDGLQRENGSFRLVAFLVDAAARPVQGVEIQFFDGNNRLSDLTDRFGAVRFPVVSWKAGRSGSEVPRRVLLTADAIRKQVFIAAENEVLRLLPAGLDSFRPLSEPLTEEVRFQLHPPAPLVIFLEARALASGWLLMARTLDADGKVADVAEIKFSVSKGELGPVRRIAPGVFEALLQPGMPGWKKIYVTASQVGVASGAMLEIEEPTGELR